MFPGIPMTCACRLMFSGITCLLVWTATFARADESRSPASAFRVIQTRYEAHLERLREEKQPVEIALNARDQALKELVEQQRDESRLEHADWVSLALAYELLRDNQACCRCCEKALELAPDNPAPCVPLLRALLSDGKADLARERAAAFTQRFPKDRDLVASVHLMLYAHLNAVQKFALAYEQLAQVIEIEFESVATSRRLHAQIVGHLRLLRDVAAQGACEPQFVAFAQELDGQLGDACKRTESDFVLGLSLRRLRTELAAIGIPARTADAQADALDFHSREVFRDPTADSLRELMKAMSQIPARAHLWGDVEELKTALRANQQRADALTNAPDCEAAVKQLRVAGGVLLGLVEQSAR